jgi:signal transduction histidine kinase/CheY-like chemotaxis protein
VKHVVFVQPIRRDRDLVFARKQARDLARLLGFDGQWQTRLATAVSEIVRNASRYAGGGDVEFSVDLDEPQTLRVRVTDSGPGIPHIDDVLAGRYRSGTGMGMGILGTKRLLAEFRLRTAPGRGTEVVLGQPLPRTAPPLTPADCDAIGRSLAAAAEEDPFEELQRQNRELLATLDEVRRRQTELDRLNAELEDTNRGVMALYAELDDKAESLGRASEAKTRFLSNMTHEFRTPLNSIQSLSRMLLDRVDGELTREQERQVSYIRKSAEDLSALVNDLLDLAKVEAGKVDVRPTEFEAADVLGGLKGVLRPLLASSTLELVFEDPSGVPTLHTDEGKLAQILRNFISNAIKYTERGTVRVRATYDARDATVTFAVSDTGIGVAPEDLARIFEEFEQVEGHHQRRVKGTGLGLPLSRRLAELLGGHVSLESEVGAGSTFSVTIPARFGGADAAPEHGRPGPAVASLGDAGRASVAARILVVDDDEAARYVLVAVLGESGCEIVEASNGPEGLRLAGELRPDAIFLDLRMPGMGGDAVLDALAADDDTRNVPVIVYTSEALDEATLARLRTRAVAVVAKDAPTREQGAAEIRAALARAGLTLDGPGREVARG